MDLVTGALLLGGLVLGPIMGNDKEANLEFQKAELQAQIAYYQAMVARDKVAEITHPDGTKTVVYSQALPALPSLTAPTNPVIDGLKVAGPIIAGAAPYIAISRALESKGDLTAGGDITYNNRSGNPQEVITTDGDVLKDSSIDNADNSQTAPPTVVEQPDPVIVNQPPPIIVEQPPYNEPVIVSPVVVDPVLVRPEVVEQQVVDQQVVSPVIVQ